MSRTIWAVGLINFMSVVTALAQQGSTKPQTYKGLEITLIGIERASSAALRDCPPGENTVRATARPGEQFTIVSVAFKLLPGYKPTPLNRPVFKDAAGTVYKTAVSFIDIGNVPEFSCTFPFRVPEGTKLKSFRIETASFDLTSDLTSHDSKKP